MKVLQSSLFRALVAIVVGVLIIKFREDTVHWLTIGIGVAFFISGLVSCAVYFSMRRESKEQKVYDADGRLLAAGTAPSFPIVGVGSMVLGLILALMPTTFITGLMYVLAGILILGAIGQYVSLGRALRFCRVGWFYWIAPTLTLVISVLMLVKPLEMFAAPLLIIGWCMMLYGVSECLNTWMIYRARKQFERLQAAEAAARAGVTAEEVKTEEVKTDEKPVREKKEEKKPVAQEQDSTIVAESYSFDESFL